VSDSGDGYVHGVAPDEQDRLARLNAMLNARSLDALALAGGERVLEMGAGLAQLARGMARRGAGHVLGIERSPEQIAGARERALHDGDIALFDSGRIELRSGDATAPPLRDDEWGGFDVAHARFLLEHVRDPLGVVRAMVRATRPGGRIVLEDDDHELLRLWPEPPGFAATWRAYMRTYERLGCDPIVGRRLVELLHQAGAQPVKTTWLWFGACAGEEGGALEGLAANMTEILRGAEAAILEAGGLGRADFAAALDELVRWSRRPDAAAWYAMAWAEGRRIA
jgi:SAM-dependent methyltransferase